MIAVIKKNTTQYLSFVLAISNDKKLFNEKIIVFDSSLNYIKLVSLYRKESHFSFKKIFTEAVIIDYDTSLFEKKTWSGISILINNKRLIKRLMKGELIFVSEIPELRKFAQKIILPKWFEVFNNNDIDNLNNVSYGFHDATLRKTKKYDNCLELEFNVYNGILTMKFADVLENNISEIIGQILSSSLKKEENCFKWEIHKGFADRTDGNDFDISSNGVYIRSTKVFWKMKIIFKE